MSAEDFYEVDADFVRIAGLPFDEGPSDWHLNDGLDVFGAAHGSGHSSTRIFQRADASEEWLGVILEQANGVWRFKHILHFGQSFEFPDDRLDAEPEIVATADTREGLADAE